MVTMTRKRKVSHSPNPKGQESFHDTSPIMAYRNLVSHSSVQFRADVEFHEKPRQVFIGIVLLGILGFFAASNSGDNIGLEKSVRTVCLGVVVLIVFYCMLQSKDGLMIRPHPMLWRAIHGLALTYAILLAVILILPVEQGISFVHDALLPDIAGGSIHVLKKQQTATLQRLDPLECRISFPNIMRQVTSIWFIAHGLGWWGKMCLLRDWSMCLTYSVAFEVTELSLVWLIPEFEECWWDSLFMDMLGANMIGLYLGTVTLKWLACRRYEWEPHDKNKPLLHHFSAFLKKFTPFSWSDYVWPSDPKCWILSSMAWIGALLLEVNSFLILHALVIRPSHWFNVARLCLLGAQGAQSVPEWYEYVRGNTERIGHNTWLMFLIATLELMIGFKYGRGGQPYSSKVPPLDTVACLCAFAILWLAWYSISAFRGYKGERRSPNWLLVLHVVSFIPLMLLTRGWVF